MKTTGSFVPTLSAALGCLATIVTAFSQSVSSAPPPAGRSGQSQRASAPRATDEVVELNPFEVTAGKDNSYGALNSNSITSFRVELDKVPVSADVFSKAFMDDIGAMEVEEMIQDYAAGAGITSGSGSPSSAASVNQPGDRSGGAAISLRGLATGGYPLRNGFYPVTSNGVGSTTTFDLDRVEVISGPQSLLYGAGGGGGVVNYVSKQAKFNSAPATELTFRIDHYGNKAGSADINVGTKTLAARVAFINQQVRSRRENVGGNMVGGCP
jgi:outer membrane receptor for monomeric catechols